MARLCVRIAPNSHPTDAKLDPMRTQVGDVVCIVDDDHQFSHCELNNGQYKIIDMPGVPQEKVAYLLDAVHDKDENMIQRRAVALDQTALKAAWDQKSTATELEIAAIVIAKPVSDPKIDPKIDPIIDLGAGG